MFTRCPGCQSVYELDAARLAEAAGMVRCGHCGKTFNSLSALFEQHPDSSDEPLSGAGMPPILDYRAIIQPELPGVGDFAASLLEDAGSEQALAQRGPALDLPGLAGDDQGHSSLWRVASLTLGLLLVIQTVLIWNRPNSPLAQWLGETPGPTTPADVRQAIQITSRDMHRHPSLDDAVIISAMLRNTSAERLAWPVVEVRLYDASQQILGIRRLGPEMYLQNSDNVDLGMPNDLVIPVILEFVVGTTLPSGFDFRFY